MTAETRLFLIRHGETAWSASGQHTSRTDLPLTVNGIRQAELLAARLARLHFAAVFTSPMRRALDTCRIAGLESAAIVTDDLREWDYGVYEGRTTDEIRVEEPGWTIWTADIRGGETVEDVGAARRPGHREGARRRGRRRAVRARPLPADPRRSLGRAAARRRGAARAVDRHGVAAGLGARDARHRAVERGEPPGPCLSDGRHGSVGDVPGTLGAVTARTPDVPSVLPERATPPAEPFALPAEAVVAALATDPRAGLSASEAASRLAANGPNELEAAEPVSLPRLIVGAVTEPFVLLLLVAGVWRSRSARSATGCSCSSGCCRSSAPTSSRSTAAERALEELRAAAAPARAFAATASVADVPGGGARSRRRRAAAGRRHRPGGPAIGRAAEPDDRPERPDRRVGAGAGVGQRRTRRTRRSPTGARWRSRARTSFAARGEGIVVATGRGRRSAASRRRLAARARRSPLQRELDRLVRILLVVAIGLIAVTVGQRLPAGRPVGANLLAGISAAIAAIPEEPPVLLAVVLGLGAYPAAPARRPRAPAERPGDARRGRPDPHRQDRHADPEPPRAGRRRTPATAPIARAGRGGSAPRRGAAGRGRRLGRRSGRSRVVQRCVRARRSTSRGAAGARARTWSGAEPPHRAPARRSAMVRDGARESDRRRRGVSRSVRPEAVLALADVSGGRGRGPAGMLLVAARGGRRRGRLVLARRDVSTRRAVADPGAARASRDPIRAGVREASRIATGRRHPDDRRDRRPSATTAVAIARAAGLGAEQVVTGAELEAWDDERLDAELPTLHVVARATPGAEAAPRRRGARDRSDRRGDRRRRERRPRAPARRRRRRDGQRDGGRARGLGPRPRRRLVRDAALRPRARAGGSSTTSRRASCSSPRRTSRCSGFILVATLVGYRPAAAAAPDPVARAVHRPLDVGRVRARAGRSRADAAAAATADVPLLTAASCGRITAAGGVHRASAALGRDGEATGRLRSRALARLHSLVVGQAVRAYANRSLTRAGHAAAAATAFLALACRVVVSRSRR